MNVWLVLQVGALGILVAALFVVLESSNRKELALGVAVLGVVIVLGAVIRQVAQFFETVQTLFHLY